MFCHWRDVACCAIRSGTVSTAAPSPPHRSFPPSPTPPPPPPPTHPFTQTQPDHLLNGRAQQACLSTGSVPVAISPELRIGYRPYTSTCPIICPSLPAPPRGEGRGVWVILTWLSLLWQAWFFDSMKFAKVARLQGLSGWPELPELQ